MTEVAREPATKRSNGALAQGMTSHVLEKEDGANGKHAPDIERSQKRSSTSTPADDAVKTSSPKKRRKVNHGEISILEMLGTSQKADR